MLFKSTALFIFFFIRIATAFANDLWTNEQIQTECSKTWAGSTNLTAACVETTKKLFIGSLEEDLRSFDNNKEPLRSILQECRLQKPTNVRGLAGCINLEMGAIRPFMDKAARGFDWGDRAHRDLTAEEVEAIRGVVSEDLKDPDSAKFKLGKYNGSSVYCGEVNAKGGFGGYTGYAAFILEVRRSGSQLEPTGFGLFDDRAERACKWLGY